MRSKEEAMDYRFFPEPDLVRVVITDEQLERLQGEMPESKIVKIKRFINDYKVSENDAETLSNSIELADYFEKVVVSSDNPKLSCNWILTEVLRILKDNNKTIEEFSISSEELGEIIKLIDKGAISSKIAKKLFEIKLNDERTPLEIVEQEKMAQVADTSEIEKMVVEVLSNNPKLVEDYKSADEGRKPRVIKGLMGQVMKASKGKANPKMVMDILTEKLS